MQINKLSVSIKARCETTLSLSRSVAVMASVPAKQLNSKVRSLSPNIHIQILLTDLHSFSYTIISWENWFKDQSNFSLLIILLILIIISLDYVLIL